MEGKEHFPGNRRWPQISSEITACCWEKVVCLYWRYWTLLYSPLLSNIDLKKDSILLSWKLRAVPPRCFISQICPPMRPISCLVWPERIYCFLPGYKMPLTLGYNERDSVPRCLCFVGEQVIHCCCVEAAVVFDLLMLKLSTSCHLKRDLWLWLRRI